MSSDPLAPIISKLTACVRMLTSDQDHEVSAAGLGIRRLLRSSGVSVHILAERIEKRSGGALNEDEMKRIYSAGYAQGVQDTENKHHGVSDFLNTDGKPSWEAVALYLQRHKDRLESKHHQFVDDMAGRTIYGREPTERQHKYLHSLFLRIGGKIA